MMQCRIPAEGSTVWIRQRLWRVERARLRRNVVRLDVRDRHGRITFFTPFDRPSLPQGPRRPVDITARNAAARLAWLVAHASRVTGVDAALGARCDVLPHQLEPALAVQSGDRRVLIADAVGLGKTIQAGLILAEGQRRTGSLRALVICPATLRDQWQSELSERFRLTCLMADRGCLAAGGRTRPTGETPWSSAGVWIGSVDYLKQPHVIEGLPLVPWDIVVIDEAHETAGDSDRYGACHELARRARHVVLLTATPHSGDDRRFSRMLRIGAFDAGDNAGRSVPGDRLVVFRRTRADVGLPQARHVRWHVVSPSPAERQLLDALASFERTVLATAGETHGQAAMLLLSVLRKRALSSTAALTCSLERRLEWLVSPERRYMLDWLQPRLDFDELDDSVPEEERAALAADVGLPPSDERTWIRRLLHLAVGAAVADTKIRRVAGLIRRANEPVIVFTEFRDSLTALERCLEQRGQVMVLHGGQPASTRRAALRRFLDGGCPTLLTTDVAGQGLNLQSRARWIINFELPWNPMRIEQRIGRVERIGQARPVHATLMVVRHRMESAQLTSLARRTLAAERALGAPVFAIAVPPTDAAVSRSLLTGAPLEMPDARSRTAASISPCTRWSRRARLVATRLLARRSLAERWRHDGFGCRLPRCRVRSPALAGVAIYVVPLLDPTGAVLERHVVVVGPQPPRVTRHREDRSSDTSVPAEMAAAVSQIVNARLEARRQRVERLYRCSAAQRAVTEHEIGKHLHALCYPEEAQTELFTQRAARAFDADRLTARRVTTTTAGDLEGLEGEVRVGEPSLELIFASR